MTKEIEKLYFKHKSVNINISKKQFVAAVKEFGYELLDSIPVVFNTNNTDAVKQIAILKAELKK